MGKGLKTKSEGQGTWPALSCSCLYTPEDPDVQTSEVPLRPNRLNRRGSVHNSGPEDFRTYRSSISLVGPINKRGAKMGSAFGQQIQEALLSPVSRAISGVDAFLDSRDAKSHIMWLNRAEAETSVTKHREGTLEHVRKTVKKMPDGPNNTKTYPTFQAGQGPSNMEKLSASRERLKKKMDAISSIRDRSPMSAIPATRALKKCASQLGHADIDCHEFIELMRAIASGEGLGTKIKEANMKALFDAFDVDSTGNLSHAYWVSVVPFFFDVKDYTAFFTQLFNELGAGDALSPKDLEKYLEPFVLMMIDPKDKEMRKTLRRQLSDRVFKAADVDGSGAISVEEFVKWSQDNSIPDHALVCLADMSGVTDPDPQLLTLGDPRDVEVPESLKIHPSLRPSYGGNCSNASKLSTCKCYNCRKASGA